MGAALSTVAKKNSKRKRTDEPIKPAARRSSRTRWRILIAAIILAAVVAGSLAMWRRVQRHVAEQPEYLVAVEDIDVNSQPDWIHTDVKAEVIRDAGLTKKISILDEHAPERISEAFGLNPWVERVAGVHTSYPAHIKVDLVYRRPVAMVAVPGGLLPIDAQGILLPTAGFVAAEAQSYPRIVGVVSSPRGLVGTPWGDITVERAARLAVLLQNVWRSLGIHHIRVPQADGEALGDPCWEIVTRGGSVFLWGASPGDEAEGETKAAEKLARLVQLASGNQGLDAVLKPQRDLRRSAGGP
jgi:cell division septal protein FtsQ